MKGRVTQAITALFVPGDRPERFLKAGQSGAGVVIVDLEDSVAASSKRSALETVLAELGPQSSSGLSAVVRVNHSESESYREETAALLQLSREPGNGLLGIMVPKAENPRTLGKLSARIPEGLSLVPLVESALGLSNALSLAQVPKVSRLAFGAIDYLLDTNATEGRFLDYARSHLVVSSRVAGIAAPWDSPSTDIVSTAPVSRSARQARRFGFGGKLCIHPAQVAVVHDAFRPSMEDVSWAQEVVQASGGAAQVNGQMVDKPVVERARKILMEAGQHP